MDVVVGRRGFEMTMSGFLRIRQTTIASTMILGESVRARDQAEEAYCYCKGRRRRPSMCGTMVKNIIWRQLTISPPLKQKSENTTVN
jgi:hypothetical protein